MSTESAAPHHPDRPSRRAVLAVFVGVIAMISFGIAAAAFFPDDCAALVVQPQGLPRVDRYADGMYGDDTELAALIGGLSEQLEVGRPNGSVLVEQPLRLVAAEGESVVLLGDTARAIKLGFATSTRQLDLTASGLVGVRAHRGAAVLDPIGDTQQILVTNGDLERLECGGVAAGRGLPLTVDRSVAVQAEGTSLFATRLDGVVRWEQVLDAAPVEVFLVGTSAVNRTALVRDAEGRVEARSALTGELTWQLPAATALRILAAEDEVLLVETDTGVALLDIVDGAILWAVAVDALHSAALGDGRVLLEHGPVGSRTIAVHDGPTGAQLFVAPGVPSNGVVAVGRYTGIVVTADQPRLLFFGPWLD